ncbi:protein PLASTID MOVEMENT IMPAIRED 2-like isoform X1 [Salvia splendens]|uniref:protein PLASTID MOVEMENT IMPAIRED 2-like isoform X1 n=1 Tax=Salvia splendens TaxID=180675 RepID=UPI001102C140|nr:protein PLASTID MOVEMENT IMPAIRED 2-like isoform X1 [Salvia splendens]
MNRNNTVRASEMADHEKPAEADTRPGSVKAAVTSYRQRISHGNSKLNNFETSFQEKPFVKRRELHWAKRDTNLLAESRKNAEQVTAEARSELFAAKKMAKDLKRRIDESNARAKSQMEDLEKLRMGKREEEEWDNANFECEKVITELELVKRELSKLKMDMASVMEETRRAEKEMNASISKRESYLGSVESLSKEIEEVNEEHVLVELARIEAIKEYEEIETQTRELAQIYASAIQVSQKKTQNIIIDETEVEARVMATMSEISMLESELKQVKEMKKGVENKEITLYQEEPADGVDSALLLESVLKELVATKKELEQVKEGSFQFMASMDVVRDELTHVMDQTARLKKEEKETEMFIQSLNSKLLKAKTKLEETSAAEDKAKDIISNLNLTLEQLESEAETHEKEKSLSSEETAVVKAEIQKSETEIDLCEVRLQAALQDLKAVKSSEALALENLKSVIEKIVRNRASASRPSSTITISKFEYEYVKGNAAGAKEIADKKVAAAQAWVEALKASEKEIQIKAELFRRETRELQVEEEREVHETEGSTDSKKRVDNDFEKWRQMMEPEKLPSEAALHVKAMNKSVKRTPTRRGMARRSASPVVPRSTSFSVGRRRKVMPNLAKLFSGKPVESDIQPT